MQHVRLYADPVSGEIRHVVTDDNPIEGDPVVEHDGAGAAVGFDVHDMVLATPGRHVRARQLFEDLEKRPDGQIDYKADVPVQRRHALAKAPERKRKVP